MKRTKNILKIRIFCEAFENFLITRNGYLAEYHSNWGNFAELISLASVTHFHHRHEQLKKATPGSSSYRDVNHAVLSFFFFRAIRQNFPVAKVLLTLALVSRDRGHSRKSPRNSTLDCASHDAVFVLVRHFLYPLARQEGKCWRDYDPRAKFILLI